MGRSSAGVRFAGALLLVLACARCGARSELALDRPGDASAPDSTADVAANDIDAAGASDASAHADADTSSDANADAGQPVLGVPRPIAPLSTATVTSQAPTLHWALVAEDDGADVEICRDRACASRVARFVAGGTSARPPSPLAPGVYFWRLRGAARGFVGDDPSATWQFVVGARSASVDTSWSTVPDVNGDGFADVIVGAPLMNGPTEDLYVFLGSASGASSTWAKRTYAAHPNGRQRDAIASAGDVNGDGFADVVVGAPDEVTGSGGAYVYLGGAGGLSTTPARIAQPGGADWSFGWSASTAGDVNGDGYADVIIGSPYASTMTGAAFLYLGGASGLDATPTRLSPAAGDERMYAYYGASLAGAGDVNGDGYGDVIVGSLYLSRVYLHLGGASGLSTTPIVIATATPLFGASLAGAGDVNGDGLADVIIGADSAAWDFRDKGSAYLYYGAASGLSAAAATLTPPNGDFDAGDFGNFVTGAGDVNGDGFADVLATTDVAAYLFLGGAGGPSTTGVAITKGQNYSYGRAALAGAGDVNGDGFADVVAGSPFDAGWVGRAGIFFGGASGLATPQVMLTSPGVPNGFFGMSVAMRMAGRRSKRS